MARFPNTFAEKLVPLPADLGDQGNEAAERLAAKGFEVRAGLTRYMAGAVAVMGAQPHIQEYCPKDATEKRFGTEESTEQWLNKGGGRGVMMLVRQDGGRPVGYGWEGAEKSEVATDSETTFAVRLGNEGTGQGLAKPFSTLIVAGSAALYGARDVWLETWGGNGAAVKSYEDIGFEEIDRHEGESRPTAAGEIVEDTRVYMTYPNELLPDWVGEDSALDA